VEIAREAIVQSGKQALLAGSLAPLEDCYRPDLVPDRGVIEHEYSHQIDLLISTGVDFILAETMINHNEIAFISSCLREKEFPYMMSFTGDGNKLLDGTPLESVIPDVIAQEPIALMLNCRRCALLTSALPMLQSLYSGVIGVYGNGPGHPDDQLGWAPEEGSSDEYQKEVMKWIERGALIVGGCCGTTPEHIAEIHAFRESLL
jgi:S-methylmethionine-dependent homocysteine/selenocysteine methylase